MINTEENHGQSVESSCFSLPPIYNYGNLNLFAPNSRQVNYYVGSDATSEQIRQLQEDWQNFTSFSEEEVQEAQALLPYMNEPQLALPYLRPDQGLPFAQAVLHRRHGYVCRHLPHEIQPRVRVP